MPKHAADEDRVLVRRHAVHDRVALADGFMKPVSSPRSMSAASRPSANVVLPRFMPVAAR